jgi:uncharacterized protein (TIGR02300 family)
MPELGKKYTCYSCHTKFYDLGKPVPLCPKCGADQRDADEAPAFTPSRSRRVVEEPVEDNEFAADGEAAPVVAEDEDGLDTPDREDDADEEEEEEY